MKKIDLQVILEPNKNSVFTADQNYRVVLGNGKKLSFGSLKAAKAALAEINRYYNFKLYQLNETLAMVYSSYRQQWFIFYDKKTGSNNMQLEHRIIEKIKMAENAINTSWKVSDYNNGPYYVVHHFRTAIDAMENAITELKTINRTKNLMNNFHRLETLRQNILWIARSIDEYSGQKFEPEAEKNLDYFKMKIAH